MSATSHTRRDVLATTAAAGAVSFLSQQTPEAAEGASAIRPFRINVPEEKLVDLRRRIAATQWPEKETVEDTSQGVQLRTMQQLWPSWQQCSHGGFPHDVNWKIAQAGNLERAFLAIPQIAG